MKFISWFIPQEKHFFDMIEEQSKNVLKGVNELVGMLESYKDLEEKRKKIKDIEHEGDRMVHNIFSELNKTFITPIDREDISALVSSLDDILDFVEAVADKMVLYKIEKPPAYMLEFAKTLQSATQNINCSISCLRNLKEAKKIESYCTEVNTQENIGDDLLRNATAELFTRKNPIEIIKLKELYDSMEAAIDRCEDVADVVGDILVKYA